MKKSLMIIAAMLLAIAGVAQVYTPSDMPNVQVADRSQYVSDPAGLLPADVKAEVNRRMAALRERTSVEAVVAIPPEIGDMESAEWCEKLFTAWGIGKSDKDNGVLLMISPGSRRAFIMTGYGVEGALPDISCKKIINNEIIPAMRDDDLASAVLGATSKISDALTDPAVAEELRSEESDNFGAAVDSLDPKVILIFVKWVAAVMFLFALGCFIKDCLKARKRPTNYSKSIMWRSHLMPYVWFSILSLGAALPFLLLAFWQYRSWRTRPLKCSTCGAKMHRLPEEKDNELLTPSQDLEERLDTVDYDVWECPECGTVERFPFKVKQTKYTECPACHTIAMTLESDRVVHPATTRREGYGVKTYECKFCGHRTDKGYRIPRKEDPAAMAAAAAVLGAAASRRGGGGGGFGGGGFGGGFGGGATGGGGAGGSW